MGRARCVNRETILWFDLRPTDEAHAASRYVLLPARIPPTCYKPTSWAQTLVIPGTFRITGELRTPTPDSRGTPLSSSTAPAACPRQHHKHPIAFLEFSKNLVGFPNRRL